MKRAIELARKGSGFVNPDPLSGAVLVKDNQIVGEAYYRSYGSLTTEKQVLMNATDALEGAELYLTIEPVYGAEECEQIVQLLRVRKVKKVCLGMRDVILSKEYNFVEELQNAGIEVELGVLKEECEELNEIYAYYRINKLPFVVVKWAMTLDGKLATRTGDSKWISSEDSLKFVHHLRQRVSAILVGENTVKKDDPLLTTRLEGIQISNPLRVIISRYGDIPMEAKVLQVGEDVKTLIIASEQLPVEKEMAFHKLGVQVMKLKETDHHIDFRDIVKALGSMGIDSLYIEGGSAILASAFESGIIQKVYAAVAPKIIGGKQAITPVGGNGIEFMRDAIILDRVSHEIIGQDVIIKGYIR